MSQSTHFENEPESCLSSPCIHPEAIRTVHAGIPESRILEELSEFYKMFGDRTRITILAALSISELCVCDLVAFIGMKQPAVSHQLRILKQSRIVTSRREGKVVYYSLSDEHIRNVLQVGFEHLGERTKRVEAE